VDRGRVDLCHVLSYLLGADRSEGPFAQFYGDCPSVDRVGPSFRSSAVTASPLDSFVSVLAIFDLLLYDAGVLSDFMGIVDFAQIIQHHGRSAIPGIERGVT
jgi:hypothetical protein